MKREFFRCLEIFLLHDRASSFYIGTNLLFEALSFITQYFLKDRITDK